MFRPLSNRVLVKRLEEDDKTPGGLFIPTTAQEKAVQGLVVAVGPGKTLNNGVVTPLELKVGEKVVFGKYSGQETRLGDTDYLILAEDEVLGVLE